MIASFILLLSLGGGTAFSRDGRVAEPSLQPLGLYSPFLVALVYYGLGNVYPAILVHATIDFAAYFRGQYLPDPAPAATRSAGAIVASEIAVLVLFGVLFLIGLLLLQYRPEQNRLSMSTPGAVRSAAPRLAALVE